MFYDEKHLIAMDSIEIICHMRKKIFKYAAIMGVGVLLACLALLLVCNSVVTSYATGRVFDDIDSIRPTEVGLLLGTTPQTRIGGRKNMFFQYRIDAAVALYNAGKIKFLLISGDENSLDGVNEVECMRDSLIARGVPGDVIYLDGKGFRTLDSVVRALKLYGISRCVIISQKFHNERAIYLAEHLDLDVDGVQAFNATSPKSAMSMMTYAREYFARVKVFLDILVDKQPEVMDDKPFLGTPSVQNRNEREEFWRDMNSIRAHNEQDTIIGNFTGHGIDTLYVEAVKTKDNDEQQFRFFMASTNPSIPEVELYGFDAVFPRLVNEGDLDGNGTCEVGYLHTWMNSQWREYRIFSLLSGEWRYLLSEHLRTSEWFRQTGIEVAEPGKKKGTVLVHYSRDMFEVKDTLVVPSFNKITD